MTFQIRFAPISRDDNKLTQTTLQSEVEMLPCEHLHLLKDHYHYRLELHYHHKSKPQGSRQSKLNLNHLIWLVITMTTTEAQSRDNLDYCRRLTQVSQSCCGPLVSLIQMLHTGLSSSHLPILLQHYDLKSCTKERQTLFYSPKSMHSNTSDNTCKERKEKKKKKKEREVMLVKNIHWTYCTFSQSYKTTYPSSRCPLHPERAVPP